MSAGGSGERDGIVGDEGVDGGGDRGRGGKGGGGLDGGADRDGFEDSEAGESASNRSGKLLLAWGGRYPWVVAPSVTNVVTLSTPEVSWRRPSWPCGGRDGAATVGAATLAAADAVTYGAVAEEATLPPSPSSW